MTPKLKKIGIATAVTVVIVGVGYYFSSPYLAIRDIRKSLLAGNFDQVNKYIDYPSIREDIKPQLGAIVLQNMRDDPEMADNPFAGFSELLIPSMVNSMVDQYVSPSGLEEFLEDESLDQALDNISMGYDGLKNFQVILTADDGREINLLFNREGFAEWTLKSVILPQP